MTSALYNFAWVLFHMTSNSYFCKQTSYEEDTLHLLSRKRLLSKVKGTSPFAVHWTAADACARGAGLRCRGCRKFVVLVGR